MKVKELQDLLQEANGAAVLVSQRVLERGLQQRFKIPAFRIWDVPHRASLVVDRRTLVSFMEPDDMEIPPERVLPDKVILLAKPTQDLDAGVDDDTLRGIYWRRLFHATIHLELDAQRADGRLTEDLIRQRIERLGPIIWSEARKVLVEENWLTAEATEEEFYVEFVAVFMELRYFLAHVLDAYFPAITDLNHVDHVLSEGLDVQLLFAQSRLREAKDPAPLEDPGADEANEFFDHLVAQANRQAKRDNLVRAAILRVRASRIAPGERTGPTRADATLALEHLVERMQKALGFEPDKKAEWVAYLDRLLEKADQGGFPVEADLLFDLQNACQDHEREIYTFSLVDWALSGGKRPVQRPLPSQRLVRILKHLRNAQAKLTRARVTPPDRDKLNTLLEDSLAQCEKTLRERYRPVLKAHLEDSGFVPRNVPEQAALDKVVEEILDRFIEAGFLSFSDLRDILARNQLKMRDLDSPQEFVRGDGLLQLDKRLGIALDGVYRPGEIYLRALERVTSLFFGTPFGRILTLFLFLPFGAGFLIAQTLFLTGHLLHQVWELGLVGGVASLREGHEDERALPDLPWNAGISLGLGLVVFAFLHWGWLRRLAWAAWEGLRWAGYELFVKIPDEIARSQWMKSFLESWTFSILYWGLTTPALTTLLVWLLFPSFFEARPVWAFAGVFVLAVILISTPLGRGVVGVIGHQVRRFVAVLREGFIVGLVRFVLDVCRQVVQLVEGFFHAVDEWLRFRSGDWPIVKVARSVLGVIWFPVSYLARFYFLVLIEPGFNPVKLPISMVMAKLMSPVWFLLVGMLPDPLTLGYSEYLLYGFAVTTITLLPDAITFLLWELSSNWQLYAANRPEALAPVVVGAHGETLRGLLQPGFHSGTIPSLYQRLRRTKKGIYRPDSWKQVRLHTLHLEEVARSVQRFVERNLLTLLKKNKAWEQVKVEVKEVRLAVSSIRVVLSHPNSPDKPLVLEFALLDGWLVGGMAEPGWFDELEDNQIWPLNTALAALYKLAGVQLVREQIKRALGHAHSFDITRDALVVWADKHHEAGYLYEWNGPEDPLVARELETRRPIQENRPPALPAAQLVYERVPLLWKNFLEAWAAHSGPRQHADVLPVRSAVVAGKTTVLERSIAEDAPPVERLPS